MVKESVVKTNNKEGGGTWQATCITILPCQNRDICREAYRVFGTLPVYLKKKAGLSSFGLNFVPLLLLLPLFLQEDDEIMHPVV